MPHLPIKLTKIVLVRARPDVFAKYPSEGFGFHIRGGLDIPHTPGDAGIFVSRIDQGSALRDRRLKEGDKIVTANGRNLEQVMHFEAVKVFTEAGRVIVMEVQHDAFSYVAVGVSSSTTD